LFPDYNALPSGLATLINLTGEYGYRNGQLLVKATVGTTLTPNGGGGFEKPGLDERSYEYNPAAAGWSFNGSTGISANRSELTSGNAEAPEGNQVAFIQGGNSASIAQSVSGLTPGVSYAVTFAAAQRGNCCGNGGEDFQAGVVTRNEDEVRAGRSDHVAAMQNYGPGSAWAAAPAISVRATYISLRVAARCDGIGGALGNGEG